MAKHWALAIGLTAALLAGVLAQAGPARAETPASQPSYAGDCLRPPTGATCLEFEDGYRWLVLDTITDQGRNHGPIEMFYGRQADYAHALGTDLVWTLPK